jgi:hypothetical protein
MHIMRNGYQEYVEQLIEVGKIKPVDGCSKDE